MNPASPFNPHARPTEDGMTLREVEAAERKAAGSRSGKAQPGKLAISAG